MVAPRGNISARSSGSGSLSCKCLFPCTPLNPTLRRGLANQGPTHRLPETVKIRNGHYQRQVLVAAEAGPAATAIEEGTNTITLYLKASDLRRSLILEVLPERKSQSVVVVGVLEGSAAEKAGIVPGQKVMAISDPIRPDQMWPLGNRPSLNFIKDTLTMMRNKDVGLQLCTAPLYTSFAVAATDADSMDEDSINLVSNVQPDINSTGAASATVAEQLAQRYNEAQKVKQGTSDVQKRIKKRKDYMEEVSKRNDNGVLAWVVALFVGPALLILAAAYFTGYLDSMYMNSLSSFK